MNNSTLKFPNNDKIIVVYKNQTFELTGNQPDNNSTVTYQCIHKECGSMIELDSKRKKIVNSNLEHMNHTVLPPLKQRLRSHKNISQTSQDTQKKVSFSTDPIVQTKPKSKSKEKNELNNTKVISELPKSKPKSHQSRDAPQQSPAIHSALTSHHTNDQSTSSITIHSDPIQSTCHSNPIQSNTVTLSQESPHIEPTVHVNIGSQTDDSISTCVSNKQTLEIIIQQKDDEIRNLKQKIASLETIIQNCPNGSKNFNKKKESNPSITDHLNFSNDFNCFILGDSHVRGLRHILSSNPYDVYSYFQPGAGYHEVSMVHSDNAYLIDPSNKDVVVLVCGTNDIGSTQWTVVQKAVDGLLRKFKHVHQICIVGVPFRFRNKKLNYHIARFNTKVKNYVLSKSQNVSFLDLNDHLKPQHYARDNLHLNRQGKSILCNEINKCIKSQINPKGVSHIPLSCEPISESIVSHDLIVLDDFEESLQTHITNMHYVESTFSSEPRSDTLLFPETSGIDNTNNSVLQNTLVSDSITDTHNPVPNVLVEPSCSHDYYRIANISHNSFSTNATNAAHSSPIPTISPGHNRHTLNFREAILKSNT